MAVTLASLRAAHPEFVDLPDGVAQDAIDQATRRHDTEVWGDIVDDGILLLACHLIAISPFGAQAQLVIQRDGDSIYGVLWRELCRTVGASFRWI